MLDRSDRRGVTHAYIIVINRVRQPVVSLGNARQLRINQRLYNVPRGGSGGAGGREIVEEKGTRQSDNRFEDIEKGQIVQCRVQSQKIGLSYVLRPFEQTFRRLL